MFMYKKHLAYPIDIKRKDLRMAKYIITQYGGPYGELAACLRYFNQRYSMPDGKGKALLTDIATEELGHVEMICAMVNQLTKGASEKELKEYGLDLNYAQHGMEITPSDVFGVPFSTTGMGFTGDVLADLYNTPDCINEKIRLLHIANNPEKEPTTTLANYCYAGMFQYSSLQEPPAILPVKNPRNVKGCYSYMFDGVEGLTLKEYDFDYNLSNEKVLFEEKEFDIAEIDLTFNKIYIIELVLDNGYFVQYSFNTVLV